MDFSTPNRVLPVLETIDRLYETEVRPREEALAHRLDDSRNYLDADGHLHPELWQARREIMSAAADAGVYSCYLPESLGGLGLGRHEMVFVEERVYRYGVGLNPALLSWTEGATPRLIFCSPQQRERFVDPLVSGRATSLHGVTEPQAGSNFFDFTTRAERRPDGTWELNGHKAFITNVFEADIAHVLCVTDSAAGKRGFTYFQFETAPAKAAGTMRLGKTFQTMWGDGITGEFVLDGLVLTDENVLGEVGGAFEISMTSINWTRMRRAGMCSGWGTFLIEATLERAKSRIVGGKPLGSNQGIQWLIADMWNDWFTTRAMSLAVTWEVDNPGPWWKTERSKDEVRKICALKLQNDEAFYRIADRAVQVHGAAGMMRDSAVNKLFLIARNLRVPGGSDEVQRSTIAQTLGL